MNAMSRIQTELDYIQLERRKKKMPFKNDSSESSVRVHKFNSGHPRGVRRNQISMRVTEAAYPYPRVLNETLDRYRDVLSQRSLNFLSTTMENTNTTRYAKLAKRYSDKPVLAEQPYWTKEAWDQHKDRLDALARPREIKKPYQTPRPSKNLNELLPRLSKLSKVPSCRLSTSADKNRTGQVSRTALAYQVTKRVKKLAAPKKSFEVKPLKKLRKKKKK